MKRSYDRSPKTFLELILVAHDVALFLSGHLECLESDC